VTGSILISGFLSSITKKRIRMIIEKKFEIVLMICRSTKEDVRCIEAIDHPHR